jgi:hypothetical protein
MASRVDRQIAHLEEIVERALRSMQDNAARRPLPLPARHAPPDLLKFPIGFPAKAELADRSSTSGEQEQHDFAERNTVQK